MNQVQELLSVNDFVRKLNKMQQILPEQILSLAKVKRLIFLLL